MECVLQKHKDIPFMFNRLNPLGIFDEVNGVVQWYYTIDTFKMNKHYFTWLLCLMIGVTVGCMKMASSLHSIPRQTLCQLYTAPFKHNAHKSQTMMTELCIVWRQQTANQNQPWLVVHHFLTCPPCRWKQNDIKSGYRCVLTRHMLQM